MFLVTPSIVAVAAGGTTDTVKLPRMTIEADVCWTLIVARTTDGHKRRIVIYYEVGAAQAILTDRTQTTGYDTVSVPGSVTLPANARICATFYGIDADAQVALYAYGYKVSE